MIQFHYTEWPCHSNPFSNALLEFRRRVRQVCSRMCFIFFISILHILHARHILHFLQVMNQHPETQDGPVIVHCK